MMLKVLIVEDEEIIRYGLVDTIDWKGMGCSVVGVAANGLEGLEAIRSLHPDLVIADICMPGMNGIDMLECARREGLIFESIILTSYAEFEYARRALEMRVSSYLLKPIDEGQLRTAIMRILEEKGADSSEEKLNLPQFILSAEAAMQGIEDPYVMIAIEQIQRNYALRISIEGIAEEQFVSASYLSRRFKAATGYTFLELLNIKRVREAIQLLLHSTQSIAEISEQTGFGDYKHFSAVFKRYMEMSPREFLHSRKNETDKG